MLETIVPIVVATVAAIATIVSAFINVSGGRKSKAEIAKVEAKLAQAEAEIGRSRAALDFSTIISDWAHIHADVMMLIEDTVIDRFLILRAWNGTNAPRWTSAVIQIRAEGQMPVPYVHFELDTDYVERLRETAQGGVKYYVTDDMRPSEIKSVYEAEGVKASIWSVLGKKDGGDGTQAVTYCSFATHSDELIDDTTRTRCKILADRLRGVAFDFEKKANGV